VKLASGHLRSPEAMPRVVVSFDPETFEQVRSRALANKTSFAEETRCLVEYGLETVNAS